MIAQTISTFSALPSAASALQSSISVLERETAALESRSSGLEPWLGWFTLLVAIGVALEIFVVIHDHSEEENDWRVCELMPVGPSLTKLGIEIGSIILVIVGIMGEFGVGLKISSINGQLRSKGAELRDKSDQLIAHVTQEADEANLKAAKIEKVNLKLQKALTNRRITKRQHDILVNLLSKHKGRLILESMSDSESGLFASDILKTFKDDAKWDVETQLPLGLVWTGLIVSQSSDPDALAAARALKAAGIPFA